MATTLETILKRGGEALRNLRNKAAGWFRRTVKGLSAPPAATAPSTPVSPTSSTPGVPPTPPPLHPRSMRQGQLIAYAYDPKWKRKLPYYDKFPLVIPLEVRGDRFIGLNLHYVDPMTRLAFIRELQAMANTSNPVRRAQYGANIINTAQAYGVYHPCIHMYLNSHVRSQIKTIPMEEWDQVVLLPWAQWVGANERDIWSGAAATAARARRRVRSSQPRRRTRT